jgi:hypothetical protein
MTTISLSATRWLRSVRSGHGADAAASVAGSQHRSQSAGPSSKRQRQSVAECDRLWFGQAVRTIGALRVITIVCSVWEA